MPRLPRPAPAILAAALAAPVAAPVAAREITGTLSYVQRIALPPDAEVVIEVRDADGAVAAQARTATMGAQVPLPFRIEAPDDIDLTLRAAIVVAGRPAWIGQPVAVAAGQRAEDTGELLLTAHSAFGPELLDCGTASFGVELGAESARLRLGPKVLDLARDPGGAEYGDGAGNRLERAGPDWTVRLADATFGPCRVAMPDPKPWRAGGNEPSWQVTIANGQVSLARLGTEGTVTAPLPDAVTEGDTRRFDIADKGLVLRVSEAPCLDAMTGMPHPQTVVLQQGDAMLMGCGGDPAVLLRGPEWRVTSLDGMAVPDGAEITLRFDGAGRVAGRSACNRYVGSYTLTGESLTFGPAAGTRMACPDPLMALEREFYAMLSRVTRFDIAEGGGLRLIAGDEIVAEARP